MKTRLLVVSAVLATLIVAPGPAPAAPAADHGTINIVSSSHQDTAWMDTPAYCRNFRIEQNIIPALEMMKKDPNYKFTMECMLHLMEFLEAHPERTVEIIELTRQGRFEWGASYNQPYESWLSGEELVRQLYYGRRWLKKNFPGCDARVYFNPDVPARSLQMQQILAKAGVPYVLGSRYTEGIYDWQSPDGSGVIFYSPAHYTSHMRMIGLLPAPAAAVRVNNYLRRLGPYYLDRGIPPAYVLLNSNDFSRPRNFNPLINWWNGPLSPWRITEGYQPPKMAYSTAAEWFDRIAAGKHLTLDRRMGERPDVWAYITGPTHHQFSDERRLSDAFLRFGEKTAVIDGLLRNKLSDWPTEALHFAWMNQLYIDHGIGGKNGHITDVVFSRRLRQVLAYAGQYLARNESIMINRREMNPRLDEVGLPPELLKAMGADLRRPFFNFSSIIDRLKLQAPPNSKILFVFNGSSTPQDAPVTIPFPYMNHEGASIFDPDGNELPWQVSNEGGMRDESDLRDAIVKASSEAGPEYDGRNAVDGWWEVGESHPELGTSQMWQSKPGPGPHWLILDFQSPKLIHQVVVRHFGCIGKFGSETKLTTADFRVQSADAVDGPWTDLVPPVVGNTLPLTVHDFTEKQVRFLRLYITRGSQPGGDGAARILEVQALERYIYPVMKLVFLARDIPPLGYKTFVVAPGRKSWESGPAVKINLDWAENEFYRVTLAPGGVKSIYDKEQGRELLNTEKWLAGEVFTMLSVAPLDRLLGTDAGEFGSMPLPVMDGSFDRVSDHKPRWIIAESGAVRTVWELVQPLADVTVKQRFTMWHQTRHLDFDVDLINFNGRPWREWRMALPLGLDSPQLTYEVPMGVVRIGKDEAAGIGGHAYGTLKYTDELKTIHPRQVQRWIDASDGRGGVTLSTSVSVFDWIDPTGSVPYPVIQPVLLASRKSCNVMGNWYPQAGDHHYNFSLYSHPGDWTNGRRSIMDDNEGIASFYVDPSPSTAMVALPPTLSFFSLSAPNVTITAIKKAEDDDDVVVRMVEMEGKDTEVTLKTYFRIESAARTNIIEEDPAPIPAGEHEVTIKIGHHAIETIKLKMSR